MSLTIELADVMLAIDPSQDTLPPITVGLYRAFLAKGKSGLAALAVYQHLLFTYRLQRTDCVRAQNRYLQIGLHWGERRVEAAKRLLHGMGLISPVQRRDAKGRIVSTYLRLNLLPNPGPSTPAENADMEKSPRQSTPAFTARADRDPKCLKKKDKCLVKQHSAEAHPTDSPSPAKNEEPRTPHGRLRALFSELYRKNTSAARAPFNSAAARQLKNDLMRLGEDRLARCMHWLFEYPPPRMKSFAYMSIHTFLPEAEKALQAEDRRLSMVRVCSGCGREQEHTGADCLFCGVPLKGARHVG